MKIRLIKAGVHVGRLFYDMEQASLTVDGVGRLAFVAYGAEDREMTMRLSLRETEWTFHHLLGIAQIRARGTGQ